MGKAKKPAPAPKIASSGPAKKVGKDFVSTHPHLFAKDPRDFRIGRDIQPKRDLSRFVKWPRYVRLQRQRQILKKRLKVPPAINQFTKTLDKNNAGAVLRLLAFYRPESREAKKKRLAQAAAKEVKEEKKAGAPAAAGEKKAGAPAAAGEKKAEGEKKEAKAAPAEKPVLLKYGINHITSLVESRKARLVVIAHDVDPIELVVWLPALCRKMDVPYCIIKGKSRLGQLVHKKTATAVCLSDIRKDDTAKLDQVVRAIRPHFNDDVSASRRWGGGIMGIKAQHVQRKREKAAQREAAKAHKA